MALPAARARRRSWSPCPARLPPRRSSPTPPRTAPAAWPGPRRSPAAPRRTDRACPDDRPARYRGRVARCPRRRATWARPGPPASPPAPHPKSAWALLELPQHLIDALGVLEAAVELEAQVGRHAQGQLARPLGAEEPGGAGQALA